MPYLSDDPRSGAKKEKGFQYLSETPFDDGMDPAREVGTSNWVFSYADMMTSMVVFLLMLLALSQVSYTKFKQVSEATAKVMNAPRPAGQELHTPMERVQDEVNAIIQKENLSEDVKLLVEAEGAILTIGESVLFESGHAALTPGAEGRLLPLLASLRSLPPEYHFVIEGHTDDSPIHTVEYASNWELSAARSLAVLLMMNEIGFEAGRLSFQAFGEFQPLVPNKDEKGVPSAENQKLNRRAVIKIQRTAP